MSMKAMVFIDGGWLYRSRQAVFAKLGEANGFEIDYAKLPRTLCEDVANQLDEDVSLVRTLYFGTIPSVRSGFNTSKQSAFYEFLEHACGYETEIHEVEVGNGNEQRMDESWCKAALASSMVFFAAQPATFDVGILVSDDPNYTPAVRRARLLGKRLQIVGLRPPDGRLPPPCQSLFSKNRVNDFPPIYLDDHAADIRLVRERVVRVCKQCGREEETTWAGPDFFCSDCRGRFRNPA